MRRVLSSFELRLLRAGVEHLEAGREDCHDCRRTPLIGERVHVFAGGEIVCALCVADHAGEPEATRSVVHSELGHAVKPAARMAA